MLFSSLEFLFFLPVVVILYYIMSDSLRNGFLLLVSLAFYAWGEPRFVFVLIGLSLLNYVFALLIDRFRKAAGLAKAMLWIAIFINIGLLFVYKYMNFAVSNIIRFFGAALPQTQIVLPIGISFFTFQALSYVIDVYRQKATVQKNPLNVCLYVAFFPQLIAGPIVRYETIAEQIKYRRCNLSDFCDGMVQFSVGMCKKVLLANTLAIVADKAFLLNVCNELSVAFSWLGAICYALQIYYDFSGYSDMAIGLGKLFGFHFDENFNYPYEAKTVTDFWRRWHISLSTWFRDYVYIPLGGSKTQSTMRNILNLLIVWMLTGIWHGAQWNFLLWGLAYFAALVLEKYLIHPEKRSKLFRIVYRVLTLLCIVLCWVLFRAEGLHAALEYFKNMLGMNENMFYDRKFVVYCKEYVPYLIPGLLFATSTLRRITAALQGRRGLNGAVSVAGYISLAALFALCVACLVQGSYNPFIYFNF